MNVTFACPACDKPARVGLDRPSLWHCPHCDHHLDFEAGKNPLEFCQVCGNRELYKKKDFPHWLGMTILVTACLTSVFTYGYYEKWLTWVILIGSAAIDGIMYLMVGDAIVCYRCNAHYRGFRAEASHPPHEITIAERYRQERIRREQMK